CELPADNVAPLEVKTDTEPRLRVDGCRVVQPQALLDQMKDVAKHSLHCTGGDMRYTGREVRNGLHCEWLFRCDMCEREMRVKSHLGSNNDLNAQCVWGTLCTGNGFSQAEEFMSMIGVPFMSAPKFRKEEQVLGNVWMESMTKMIHENGKEEVRIAREQGRTMTFCGKTVCWCVVKGDGGWSMRSYGHSYNAKSGVVSFNLHFLETCEVLSISGDVSETGRILFLMVKNVYYSSCEWAKRNKREVRQHICFRNHKGSSSAMEQEGTAEGFHYSIEEHGLLYKKYIGDGDASTMTGIRDPRHALRLSDRVRQPYDEKLLYEGACHSGKYKLRPAAAPGPHVLRARRHHPTRRPPGDRRPRRHCRCRQRRSAGRCLTWRATSDQLRRDLQNLSHHVLGRHTNCEARYCERKDCGEEDLVETAGEVFKAVMELVEGKLLQKDSSLVFNENTNDCERYMGMVAKMTGGKRVDHSLSGSYQRRCTAAAFATDLGPDWVKSPMRKLRGGRTPEATVKRLCVKREKLRSARRLAYAARQEKPGASRFKRKRRSGPDGYYGEAQEDIPEDERRERESVLLAELEEAFGTAEKRTDFETKTRDAFDSDLYRYWHNKLLTSTHFKDVIRRKAHTPCEGHVKSCLYPTSLDHLPAIDFGKKHERRAVELFEREFGKRCRRAGLSVCAEPPYCLATTSDGVVVETMTEDGKEKEVDGDELVEVNKCLPSVQGPLRDANVPCLELVDPEEVASGKKRRRKKGEEETEVEKNSKILRLR
ncbi:LOW QUALITY PROTEIN: Titin-like protein, partial [Frankliniella fusca]